MYLPTKTINDHYEKYIFPTGFLRTHSGKEKKKENPQKRIGNSKKEDKRISRQKKKRGSSNLRLTAKKNSSTAGLIEKFFSPKKADTIFFQRGAD